MIEKIGRLKLKSVLKKLIIIPLAFKMHAEWHQVFPQTRQVLISVFSSKDTVIMSDLHNRVKEDLVSAILFYRKNYDKINNV